MSAGAETGEGPEWLSEVNFDDAVLGSDVPVLVAFSASWCAPCAWLEPYLREVLEQAGSAVRAFKIDADESSSLVERYRVMSLPTVICFREGREVDRSLGIEPQRLRRMAGLTPSGSPSGQEPGSPDRQGRERDPNRSGGAGGLP